MPHPGARLGGQQIGGRPGEELQRRPVLEARRVRYVDHHVGLPAGAREHVGQPFAGDGVHPGPRRCRDRLVAVWSGIAGRVVESAHQPGHRRAGQLGGFLADGAQVDVRQPGQRAVVESQHRNPLGYRDARAHQDVEHAEGAAIVEGEDRRRQGRTGAEQGRGGGRAFAFGQTTGHGGCRQVGGAHGLRVTAAPLGGAG